MYDDEPQDRVHDVLAAAVHGDHPLGRRVLGDAEVIGSIPVAEISSYHDARYTGPNLVVAAAGHLEHEQIVELAQRGLSAAGRRAQRRPRDPRADAVPRFEFQAKETEQYHICFGGPGIARSDERRFALGVLDAIFGGSTSSRLFREVREKRGLAYAVGSYSEQYMDGGMVATYVGTREENVREACEIIGRELGDASRSRGQRRGARARQGARQGTYGARAGGDRGPHVAARPRGPVRRPAALARRDARADRRRSAPTTSPSWPPSFMTPSGSPPPASAPTRSTSGSRRPHQPPPPQLRLRGRRRVRGDPGNCRDGLIRVAVSGAAGRMGATVCEAVDAADDLELAGRADPSLDVPLSDVLTAADVVVDFTTPQAAARNVRECLAADVHAVVGTTGFELEAVRVDAEAAAGDGRRARVFVAPNFAIGAVLMMQMARQAAAHMPECEIIELHHDRQARRPVGHRQAHRRPGPRGRWTRPRPDPLGATPGPGRPPGGDLRRRGPDALDPPRLDRPPLVHAGRPAGRAKVGDLPDPFTVGLENLL